VEATPGDLKKKLQHLLKREKDPVPPSITAWSSAQLTEKRNGFF